MGWLAGLFALGTLFVFVTLFLPQGVLGLARGYKPTNRLKEVFAGIRGASAKERRSET